MECTFTFHIKGSKGKGTVTAVVCPVDGVIRTANIVVKEETRGVVINVLNMLTPEELE
jgi:hypothetical protein